MAVEITSVGDAAFLWQVLNSVAMVTSTKDFLGLARLGFMVGVLLIGLRALLSQKFEIHHMMMSMIIFFGLFVPKETVIINDAYSGGARAPYVVDNVPVGIAKAGQIISSVGYGLTKLMEQAFQPIGAGTMYTSILEDGFMDPLRVLIAIRDVPYDPADPLGARMLYNLPEHVKSCTMMNVERDGLQAEQFKIADDVWAAIRSPSAVLTQNEKQSDGSIKEVTCTQAAQDIDAAMSGDASGAYGQMVLNSVAKFSSMAPNPDGSMVKADDAKARIDSYLNELTSVGADSWKFVNNQIMMQYVALGGAGFAEQRNNLAYAYALQTAKQRRDLNHAAQGNMFYDIMRPMMSFLEAFVYAIAPVMCFLLVIGPIGIQLGSKYLLLIAWVQMWLPVLAIVRLYTFMTVNAEMSSFAATHTLNSDFDAWHFQQVLSSQLGICGLLIASVPVITLMLVTGGAVTANAIASRLSQTAASAASTIEGTLAPNPMSATAGEIRAGDHTRVVQGMGSVTGGHGVDTGEQYSFRRSQSAAFNSQKAEVERLAGTSAVNFANVMQDSIGSKLFGSSSQSVDSSVSAQTGESWKKLYNTVESTARSSGIDLKQEQASRITSSLMGQIGADGHIEFGSKKLGAAISAAISGTLQDSSSSGGSASQSRGLSVKSDQSDAFAQALDTALSRGYKESDQKALTQGAESLWSIAKTQTGSHAIQASQDLSRSRAQTAAFQQAADSSLNISGDQAQQAARNWAIENRKDLVMQPSKATDEYMKQVTAAVANGDNRALAQLRSYNGHNSFQLDRAFDTLQGWASNGMLSDVPTSGPAMDPASVTNGAYQSAVQAPDTGTQEQQLRTELKHREAEVLQAPHAEQMAGPMLDQMLVKAQALDAQFTTQSRQTAAQEVTAQKQDGSDSLGASAKWFAHLANKFSGDAKDGAKFADEARTLNDGLIKAGLVDAAAQTADGKHDLRPDIAHSADQAVQITGTVTGFQSHLASPATAEKLSETKTGQGVLDRAERVGALENERRQSGDWRQRHALDMQIQKEFVDAADGNQAAGKASFDKYTNARANLEYDTLQRAQRMEFQQMRSEGLINTDKASVKRDADQYIANETLSAKQAHDFFDKGQQTGGVLAQGLSADNAKTLFDGRSHGLMVAALTNFQPATTPAPIGERPEAPITTQRDNSSPGPVGGPVTVSPHGGGSTPANPAFDTINAELRQKSGDSAGLASGLTAAAAEHIPGFSAPPAQIQPAAQVPAPSGAQPPDVATQAAGKLSSSHSATHHAPAMAGSSLPEAVGQLPTSSQGPVDIPLDAKMERHAPPEAGDRQNTIADVKVDSSFLQDKPAGSAPSTSAAPPSNDQVNQAPVATAAPKSNRVDDVQNAVDKLKQGWSSMDSGQRTAALNETADQFSSSLDFMRRAADNVKQASAGGSFAGTQTNADGSRTSSVAQYEIGAPGESNGGSVLKLTEAAEQDNDILRRLTGRQTSSSSKRPADEQKAGQADAAETTATKDPKPQPA